ncbi:MAG: DUF2270 domain-containing protein, partial [Pseudomonadota bacterium]
SFQRSMGRRIRRNYGYIFAFQALAYVGKIVIHPTPIESLGELLQRSAVGPIPGAAVLAFGAAFHGAWIALALWSRRLDRAKHGAKDGVAGMG